MKNKTHGKRIFCIALILATLISSGYHIFAVPATHATDANGNPETFEEFQAQISDVYAKRDELTKIISIVKEYDNIKAYQEIWDILERYVATEEIADWQQNGPPSNSHYQAESFSYDGNLLQELVIAIQKYDPNFHLTDDSKDNNVISSLSNLSIPEIAFFVYNVLYVNHINLMLDNAQTHFDKNIDYPIGQKNMVSNFLLSVNKLFESGILLYDYTSEIAELYNRIMSHDTFTEVQTVFQKWQNSYSDKCLALRKTMHILEHGEELTTIRYFPTAGGPPFAPIYLGTSIASKFQETYTLEQLVNYLPSHSSFPGVDKDETITLFTNILKTETQNLKDLLAALDPTLINLDNKTANELLTLSKRLKDPNTLFQDILQNVNPKTQQLASLLIQFNFDTLHMLLEQYPADKYFTQLATIALTDMPAINTLTIEQIKNQNLDQTELYNLYGLIGNAALQIDPTITEGLYSHPDWVIPESPESPEDPTEPTPSNPNDTPTTPSNPSQDSSDGSMENLDKDALLPNTGVVGKIISGATSTTGIIIISSIILVSFAKKFLCRRSSRR